ncbi:MAG TPA: hypothetical protein VF211_10375 [Burkholderiales bacterium]
MRRVSPFAAAALRLSAPVLVWALHFAAVYGFTGLACARGWASAVPGAVGAASVIAAAAALAIVAAGWRRRAELESWLSAALGGFALVAIAYEALGAWIVPACA